MGLELVSGEDGADAPVRWVHSSELVGPTPWLSGGELLLTTGIQLESEERQREFVRLLAGHHLAGLGFGTGFNHASLPDALVEEARGAGFPIFEVPYELPFIALTEKAFTRLVNEQYEVLQRGIAIHKRLERLVLEESGLDEVVRALAAATGGAVRVPPGRGDTLSAKAVRRQIPEAPPERGAGRQRQPDGGELGVRARPSGHRGALARTARLPARSRRAAGVARGGEGHRRARRLRAADPPAGRHGRGPRADAPARHAR